VVAAHNLRRHGSKADVIVMVQISATTNATRLPELEEMLLQAMNISVVYLPKYTHYKLESFYSLMMEKFRVLQLEEYSRVLYLDADILPLCNLDYMMKLSESGKFLRENVVLAYKGEPASGGFFVLRPNASDYVELVEIIKKTESKYLELEYPHWDPLEVCC
jgi:alpha-N-acetylglucosamine transferase